MIEANSATSETLAPSERAVARIGLLSEDNSRIGAESLLVTDQRILRNGVTLFWWDEARGCFWIHRDREQAAKLKHTHFQRLIIQLKGGREVTLDHLGQAVFPLLKFLWSLGIGR